jgi:hypothetical protein
MKKGTLSRRSAPVCLVALPMLTGPAKEVAVRHAGPGESPRLAKIGENAATAAS